MALVLVVRILDTIHAVLRKIPTCIDGAEVKESGSSSKTRETLRRQQERVVRVRSRRLRECGGSAELTVYTMGGGQASRISGFMHHEREAYEKLVEETIQCQAQIRSTNL